MRALVPECFADDYWPGSQLFRGLPMKKGREERGPGRSIDRPPIVKVALIQFAVIVLVSCGLWLVDPILSYSLGLGGLVALIPQLYFAVKVFRYTGAGSATQIARSSYAGEVGKFALSAAGFGLIFALVRPLQSEAVFAGFVVGMIIQLYGNVAFVKA